MRMVLLVVMLTLAVASAWAERVQVIWEQSFDVAALSSEQWRLEGAAELKDGALETRSDPNGPELSGAFSLREEPIPTTDDGYWLRVEYAVTPVTIGSMGQAAATREGPFVVLFGEGTAGLNLGLRAKVAVGEGKEAVVSCDFLRDSVLSWKIGDQEQLDRPVSAWKGGASKAQVMLGDLRNGGSVSRWHWARLSRVYPDDPLPLRLARWDDLRGVQSGQPAAFLVGQANAMEKVFREASDFSGSFDPHVRVAAAGRERESFQLVVMPVQRALRGVRVEVSELVHGEGKTRLSSANVQWYRLGYVQTQPSNSAVRRVGWWWPDVLLLPEAFDVELGFVQPVWFTVSVPAEAKAGVYRGLVTVKAEGETSQTMGLELTVRPFSLPMRGKLKTAFCFSPIAWEAWYRPSEVRKLLNLTPDEKTGELGTAWQTNEVLPHEKWLRVYDFLLAHRLSPTVIYNGLDDGKARVIPGREDMEYCYDRGMNATCLVNVDKLPDGPAAANKYMRELEAYLADWTRFIEEKHWPDFTWYVHGFDESDMRESRHGPFEPSINRIYGMIGRRFPRIKRESANPLNPAHIGLFDIWTPLTAQWSDDLKQRQAAGDEVWAYVCCSPTKPFANFFTDFPGVDPRILPWQFYQHGATGFLYYMLNYYESQENRNLEGPKWPERPWNTLSFGCNNDGVLIYPGPDATPLASTRLENLRDGIEDYEALAILSELTKRLEAVGGHEDLVTQAREVLSVRPEVSKSWTEYTQDPAVILRARAEVDRLIEAVTAVL